MTVIAFVGRPRTGKTLFMTFFAYNNYQKGHIIFSNYRMNFPSHKLDVYDMLNIPFDDVDRYPKTLCIQEADKIFDSRRSSRSENVLLSSLTGQSGKRNLDIFYDTQFFNRIDDSLRKVTEMIITSRCYYQKTNKEDIPIAFEYSITDVYEYLEKGIDYKPKKITVPALLLKPYFKMYDSYEATEPITTSRKMKDYDSAGGKIL